jgi:disulfide bond formation protein DsbB
MEKKQISEKARKSIYYFEKSVFFIMTCALIFIYTRTLYSIDWVKTAVKNSGMSPMELAFVMGIIMGIWCFFAFILLVFTSYEEKKEVADGKEIKS